MRPELFIRPTPRNEMKIQVETTSDNDSRVVAFSPRGRNSPHAGRRDKATHGSRKDDGSQKKDSGPGQPDGDSENFRYRMLTNAIALVITIALVAFGIWLATSIADLRKTQDCILMGRRNCAPIATPN